MLDELGILKPLEGVEGMWKPLELFEFELPKLKPLELPDCGARPPKLKPPEPVTFELPKLKPLEPVTFELPNVKRLVLFEVSDGVVGLKVKPPPVGVGLTVCCGVEDDLSHSACIPCKAFKICVACCGAWVRIVVRR